MAALPPLIIRGARVHNLKNISVEIPREKLIVITGLSGSGKSSLAFDTIYVEGQRRYVESLSSYARQFLEEFEKPDVDEVEGIAPAIAINERSAGGGIRSTVGTITEMYDLLRLLFTRIGVAHCSECKRRLVRETIHDILGRLEGNGERTVEIIAPLPSSPEADRALLAANLLREGIREVEVDGVRIQTSELARWKGRDVRAVVGSAQPKDERRELIRLLERAVSLGEGHVIAGGEPFLTRLHCPHCRSEYPELSPRKFSFNSPQGACPDCTGLGRRIAVDPSLVIPNPTLTIAEGAIRPFTRTAGQFGHFLKLLAHVAGRHRFSLDSEVARLPKEKLHLILYGTGEELYEVEGFRRRFEGVIPYLERTYRTTDSDYIRSEIERYMVERICEACDGKRLRKESLAVTIDGASIADLAHFSISELLKFSETFQLARPTIVRPILEKLRERAKLVCDVGLPYLSLDRPAPTLAAGEAQRLRLATQISTGLRGVIYVLDEPTIGLHPRDSERLIEALRRLRDLGNTVIVVEHDEEVIRAADWTIDLGPKAGKEGGEIIATGPLAAIIRQPRSLTGSYLSGKRRIPIPQERRRGSGELIEIRRARAHNLKNITVRFPLGTFSCVTGVSGAGKSSLVLDILARALRRRFLEAREEAPACEAILGLDKLDKAIIVDQAPIGLTPRSNPATYTSVFSAIRRFFASLPEARKRHFDIGDFSFNVRGGRCEACKGEGVQKIEMYFLPAVEATCNVCEGKRYRSEILHVRYLARSIADVLAMSVDEALEFFTERPEISEKLRVLTEVGLGYIQLGQPAPTLSGGEAQRVKLATELARRPTGHTLYILDEPTTGLHFEDVRKLLNVLNALVEKGNTVLVIEHNPHVIKTADYIIDLGPEGGDQGGTVVATGTPEEVATVAKSYTGKFLKKYL